MAQFLSAEWVEEFNDALGSEPLGEPAGVISLAAEDGHLSVLQQIHDVPTGAGGAGSVRTLLRVDRGVGRLSLVAEGSGTADVTVSISYSDAVALSKGELDPATALGTGRIQVRGDLSVLVAGQAMLGQAEERLAGVSDRTSY